MKEIRYQNENKVYVKVAAIFSPDGKLKPMCLWWEDGRRYAIDRILDVCRTASTKAGGIGLRYACIVHGHETYLYFEEDRWYVERR